MSIFFEWTKNISVGNDMIDSQHKRLLAQLNKIIEAMVFGAGSQEVKDSVAFFDQYIKEHFTYEEEYMKQIGFPEIEAHKAMHHDFIQKYYRFKEELNQGVKAEKLIIEIENYIGVWWVDHIGKEDKKYQLFAEGK